MTTVPIGVGAYDRKSAKEPEIQLINRFLEGDPTNLVEHTALLSRFGTKGLGYFPPNTSTGIIRGLYSKEGLFDSNLFVVSGNNLYRRMTDGTRQQITGTVHGTGRPYLTWVRGAGYQRLVISDGQLLQYYDGGSHATGILTTTATPTNQVIEIAGTYYSWHATDVDYNSPDGTAAHPFLALLGSDPLVSMENMLNFAGVPGVDFSSALGAANTVVTALADTSTTPSTKLTLTAISEGTDGNLITTSVYSGASMSWSGATLTGGGIHALHGIYVPTGETIGPVCTLDSFVLCAVNNSQKFFYLRPASVIIDALDFDYKESNPDFIVDMVRMGDFAVIVGSGSTEFWYATGDSNQPLAPVDGRTMARGAVEGTVLELNGETILVGNDEVVYAIGNGMRRISNHGIEERIRTQIRREKGIT